VKNCATEHGDDIYIFIRNLGLFFFNEARGVARTDKLENDLIKGGMPRKTYLRKKKHVKRHQQNFELFLSRAIFFIGIRDE